ncbi:sensor histidine kinase [Spirillospora sp. NPDC127200]
MAAPPPGLPSSFPARDAALAAGVALLITLSTAPVLLTVPAETCPYPLVDVLLIAGVCGPLLLWRSRPLTAGVHLVAATVGYYAVSPIDGPLVLALLPCLYAVAAAGRSRAAAWLTAAALAGLGLGALAGAHAIGGFALVMLGGWAAALVALGAVRHGHSAQLRAAEDRALAAARGHAADERRRIARELHDGIGHHISMISVQAGVALHRIRRDPDQAAPALGVIKEAGGTALRELRATLGVLRQVDGDAPAPGLDRAAGLVRHAEAAGLAARLLVVGEQRALPPAADLAAYRILQEAVTNVIRHAGARAVVLTIAYDPAGLRLEIDDDGAGGGTGGSTDGGSGIAGMRERARALGGDLSAGPVPGGGFRVRARLPYRDPRAGGPA